MSAKPIASMPNEFLQKFFLYGSLIRLLTQAGWRLRSAIFSTALILFMTSEAERFLPDRSAEINDTFMVLVIGMLFALIGIKRRNVPAQIG